MPKPIILFEDSEDETTVPSRYEICGRCHGEGVHDAWDGGMTRAEMDEADPDFFEDYMNGMYDVRCEECNGERVVTVVDEERCSPEQLEVVEKYYEEERERAAEARMRRLGYQF